MSIKVMGIINLSPESFFKGSIKNGYEEIASTARRMKEEGASIIDIGAMSTAPYLNTLISDEEEIARLRIGIKAVKEATDLPISIDTPRSRVAKEALRLEVDMINDITGLKYDENMVNVIKDYNADVVVCAYSKDMVYGNIKDTIRLLKESIDLALSKGIDQNKIIIDPAIGFFRNKGNNPFFTLINGTDWFTRDLLIIKHLGELRLLNKHICVSSSRKSFIGKVLNIDDPSDRLIGSVVTEAIAVMNGADIIRSHNVYETMQAIRMAEAIRTVQ